MAIQYADKNCKVNLDGSVPANFVAQMKAALLGVDWIDRGQVPAVQFFAKDTNLADSTITVVGTSYYSRGTINNANPRQFYCGASALDFLTNWMHCVRDDGIGKGTLYSSATPGPDPNVTACIATPASDLRADYSSTPTLQFNSKLAGTAGNGAACSGGNGTWRFTAGGNALASGGYKLDSKTTPQGLAVRLLLMCCPDGYVDIQFISTDETKTPGKTNSCTYAASPRSRIRILANVVGRLYNVIANPYQFFIYLFNSNAFETWAFGCVPYLLPNAEPLPVSNASINEDGTIRIQTASPHGKETGQTVSIGNLQGLIGVSGASRSRRSATRSSIFKVAAEAAHGSPTRGWWAMKT